jgi:Mce-associated membrane protein
VSDNNNTDVDVPETAVDEAELADTAADEATGADESEETDTDSTPRPSIVGRSVRAARSNLGVILLAAALLASAGVATWLYFNQYRPDQQTDAAASQIALDAAKTGTVALLSYSPESLDKDFAAAKSHLTGDFLSYYTQFTETIVTPAAQQKAVKTTASVVRAAVSELRPHSAVVLVFVNRTRQARRIPTARSR